MLIASLLFGVSASLDALLVGISYGIRGIRIRLWQNLFISLVTLLGTCLSVGLGQRLAPLLPGFVGRYAGSLVLIALGIYYIAKWAAPLGRSRDAGETQVCVQPQGTDLSGTEKRWPVREEGAGRGAGEPEVAESSGRDAGELESAESSGRDAGLAEPILAGPDAALSKKGLADADLEPTAPDVPAAAQALLQLSTAEVLTLSLTLSLNNLSAGLSASLAGLTLIPAAVSTIVCSILFLLSGNRLGRNPVLQLAGRAADPLSGLLLIGLGLIQIFI